MVEPLLFFALGFSLAGLSVLAIVPALWRRALRLTRERARLLLPQTAEEALANVDLARARVAVAERDAEIKVERANARRAAAAGVLRDAHVEIGRLAGLLAASKIDARTAAGAHSELTTTAAEAALARDRSAADARKATMRAERVGHDLARSEARARAFEEVAERRRASVAALETRVAGLQATVEDLRGELARAGIADPRTSPAPAPAPDELASVHLFPRLKRTETAMPIRIETKSGAKSDVKAETETDAKIGVSTLDDDVMRLREVAATGPEGSRRDERLRAMVDAIGAKFLVLSEDETRRVPKPAAQNA